MALPAHSNKQHRHAGDHASPGVSELLIPSWEQDSLDLVLPMLAHLSHQTSDRWLTWLGQTGISKQDISTHSFDANKLRTIRSQSDEETLWMMWDALNNGTSAFVVAIFNDASSVSQKEIEQLEQACFSGNTRALVIKCPNSN